MGLSDILIPLTARQLGPDSQDLNRPRVYYLKAADLGGLHAETTRNTLTIKELRGNRRKVELYESPDEFIAMQSLSQGVTANAYFTKAYQNLAPTSSATAADAAVASKYYNEISTINGGNLRLPDPFAKRIVVLNNMLTGPVNVFGRGTTTSIDGSTAAFVLKAGVRKHFVAPTAATAGTTAPWKTAVDTTI